MDLSLAAVGILGGLVVLRWILIALGAALIVRSARECPACFEPTVPIRRRLLTAVLRIAEWRWCPSCGWQGPSRKPEHTRWNVKSASSRA